MTAETLTIDHQRALIERAAENDQLVVDGTGDVQVGDNEGGLSSQSVTGEGGVDHRDRDPGYHLKKKKKVGFSAAVHRYHTYVANGERSWGGGRGAGRKTVRERRT